MNQTLHLVKKDARHLRWAFLAWAAVVAARVLLDLNRASLELHGVATAIIASQMASLVSFIELLMMGFILSSIVHEDPLVGRDAFWLTRPLEPRRLAAAKLTMVLGALVLLPLAGDLVTIATFHAGARDLSRAVAPIVIARLWSVLPLMVLAALTPSLARYVLAVVVAAGALVVFAATMMTGALLFTKIVEASPRPEITNPTPGTAGAVVVIAVSLGIVLYQYRYRRLKIAVTMAAAGLAAAVAVPMLWPWRPVPLSVDPGPWARDQAHTIAVIAPEPPNVSDAMSFSDRNSARKQIAARVRLTGIPDDVAVRAVEVKSRLELSAATLVSTAAQMVNVHRDVVPGSTPESMRPLQAVLGDVELTGRSGESEYEQWPVLLFVSDQEFAQYARAPGRLTAALDFHLSRYVIASSSRLEPGATFTDAARRVQITRVERRAGGCTVILRELSIESLFKPRVHEEEEFVLRNSVRREAIRGEPEWLSADNSSPVPFLLNVALGVYGSGSSAGRGFTVRNYAVRYPARNTPASGRPVIDAAWLDNAELVRIKAAYGGNVARSVTVENFRMVQ